MSLTPSIEWALEPVDMCGCYIPDTLRKISQNQQLQLAVICDVLKATILVCFSSGANLRQLPSGTGEIIMVH